MSKVVITGGAGFIGSHIADSLSKKDYEVIIVDNFDPYYSIEIKKRNVDMVLKNRNTRFIKGDICDSNFIKTVIDKETDFVFHEAAQPGVRISVENPYRSNNVNILGSLNVLKQSMEANVTRVINASSSSVYGKIEYLPFDEKHPKQPISPYAVSKLAAEHYFRVFYEIYNIPTVSLRYFTVYGPRMRPDLAISIFTGKMINNEPITIFGDGTQTRDFTYIDDVVNANEKLLKTNKVDGKILNIGKGKRTDINEIADYLKRIIGSSSKIHHVEFQKGDAKHTLANIDLAKKLIGYNPKTDFSEGATKYLSWFKKNHN